MSKYSIVILFLLFNFCLSEELYDNLKVYKLELEFYDPDYKALLVKNKEASIDIPAKLIFNDNITLDSVGVRYKGNSSYNVKSDKKPFNISVHSYREDQNLLGYKTLNLNNGFKDPTFMREVIVNRIYSNYLPSMKTGYVYLYINGEEYGLYTIVQQINKDFLGEWYEYKSGNLYKGDPRGELIWKGSDPSLYKSDYEKKTNEDEDDWSDLINLINAVNNSSNLYQDLPKYLNTDRALWYFALSNIFVNLDSYIFQSHNYYIYNNPATGLMDFLPWDLNESFGTFGKLPIPKYEFPPVDSKAPNRNPLFKKMLADDIFREIYYAHYRTLLNEFFNVDSVSSIVDELKPVIESYVNNDPKKLYSFADFNTNIVDDIGNIYGIYKFIDRRRTYLLNQPDFKKEEPRIEEVRCLNDEIYAGNTAVFNVVIQSSETKNVSLHYRLGKGAFHSIEMFDDGNHDDGSHSDGIYGIDLDIPESTGEGNIDFYATAVNNSDVVKFYPERAEFVFLTKEITRDVADNDIVINEFMASNATVIQDPQGAYPDWIELYNRSSYPVSLNGWYLTDEISEITKWKFPDVTIPAEGYLIIWADNDEGDEGLHTNYKLSRSGEYIVLYNAQKELVDSYSYGEQTTDISEGRYPNGSGEFTFMNTPTPGEKNVLISSVNDEPPAGNFLIFPNPVNNTLYMSFSVAAENMEVSVYNGMGKLMDKIIVGSGISELNTDYYSSGIYYIRARIGNEFIIKKFIKM